MRYLRAIICTAMAAAVLGGSAYAQSFPSKPITILAGAPPGGGTDIMARTVGDKFPEVLKQPAIVDNRPGASNTIAAQLAANAPPDGYTLLLGNVSSHAIAPNLLKLRFDPIKDFVPIALVATVPNVLVVNPNVPAKTVKELVAMAKAKPGQLRCASSGIGSTQHMICEAFKLATGTQIDHVPYKGSAQAATDLLGGQVEMNFDTLPSAIGYIRAGKVRPLAVTSAKRSTQLPQVPTFSEAGVPSLEMTTWYALYAPAKTPKAIVAKLEEAVAAILKMPDVQKRLESVGSEAAAMTPEQFNDFARAEYQRYAKLIKEANIKAE